MASNGSLMTVPDFPNRLRELKKRGGRMVVFDPRRTETAKVADEHHFIRPATDAVVLLAMMHVLFEEGLTDPPSYVAGRSRCGWRSPTSPRSTPRRASGVPADEIRRITREFAAADGAAAYGRIGSVDPGVRLDLPVGDPVPEHPHRQLRPRGRGAVPRAGRRHRRQGDHRARAPRRLAQPRARRRPSSAASCRSARCARRSRLLARARSARCSPSPATRCSPRPTDAGSATRSTGSTSWRRSTSTSTRRPGTPTWSCRRPRRSSATSTTSSSTPSRSATRRGSPRPVFEKPEGAMDDWEIFREIALRTAARLEKKKPLRQGAHRAGPAQREPDDDRHRRCCSPAVVRRCGRCGPTRRGRPRPAASRPCRRACRPRTS